MQHLMKHVVMVAVGVALVAGGYIAYQHCYGAKKIEVRIQSNGSDTQPQQVDGKDADNKHPQGPRDHKGPRNPNRPRNKKGNQPTNSPVDENPVVS